MPSTENIRRKMFILPIIDCYIEEREERIGAGCPTPSLKKQRSVT
jgi:hypothetical protein